MRILFIAGLHPVKANPMSAIFITRRMKKLQERGLCFDLFFFSEKTGWFSRFLKNLLNRPSFKEKSPVTVDGIHYEPLPVAIGFWDMAFYERRIGRLLVDAVKEKIDIAQYDLIHAIWAYPHGYIGTLLKQETGIPCVVSVHGSDIHTDPFQNPKSVDSVVFALEYADRVLFNNFMLLETAKKLGYSGSNSSVIPNGVDTDLFVPVAREKARADLGLSPLEAQYIGFVGNLKSVKRADRLPDIFNEVAKQSGNTRFIVIGDGKMRRKIERKCNAYNLDVIFTGRIDQREMPLWMSALDVLILPSRSEGFPNVCIEAQSCGCPVVGSSAGGIPEAIGDGGAVVADAGANFEKQFSDAVIRLLEKPYPREQLRKRALQFNWEQVIQKQIDLYDDILKKEIINQEGEGI